MAGTLLGAHLLVFLDRKKHPGILVQNYLLSDIELKNIQKENRRTSINAVLVSDIDLEKKRTNVSLNSHSRVVWMITYESARGFSKEKLGDKRKNLHLMKHVLPPANSFQ